MATKRSFDEVYESEKPSDRVIIGSAPSIALPTWHFNNGKFKIPHKGPFPPFAKMSMKEIVEEENRREQLFNNRKDSVLVNPFPHIEGLPSYPWETSAAGVRYWYNKALSPHEAYVCDRLYHKSTNGFVFPIMASIAPKGIPQFKGKAMPEHTLYLVMCPMASDDFHLYSRIISYLWDCANAMDKPALFLHMFSRSFIDWRPFHSQREQLAVKMMWYIDDLVKPEEWWADITGKFIRAVKWDSLWEFPNKDELEDPTWLRVQIVRDAVYWPIRPPPSNFDQYGRIRYMPVYWSEL